MNPSQMIKPSLEDLTAPLKRLLQEIRVLQALFSKQVTPFSDGSDFLLRPLKDARNWAEENLKPAAPSTPPALLEEIVRKWKDGNRDFTSRELNQLCWHPPAGTDPQFLNFLISRRGKVTARHLHGLVYSYHSNFSTMALQVQGGLGQALRGFMADYVGRNRVVNTWRGHLDLLLGADAPRRLGQEILRELQPVERKTESLLISGNTSFVKNAVAYAIDKALDVWPQSSMDQRAYLYEHLMPQAELSAKQQAAGRLIIKAGRNPDGQYINEVKNYVLGEKDLGDPRLPQNGPNWLGIDEAKGIFIQWLSLADITFFFELVIADAEDVHRRKAFWLNYVEEVKRSWVILNDRDYYRLRLRQRELQRNLGDQTVGRFRWPSSSAFILDFGRIVVVEFSQTGNAAYVYHAQEAADFIEFWRKYLNYHGDLKRPEKTCSCFIPGQNYKGKINHSGAWEYRARQMLVVHGIRHGWVKR
jgi:hypothetical protein